MPAAAALRVGCSGEVGGAAGLLDLDVTLAFN